MSRTGKAFLYLVYFAIVAGLSGVIITSSKSNPPAAPKAPSVSQHRKQTTAAPPKSAAPSNPKPTASPPTSLTPTTADNTSSLVNTGPGNLAGLFVATSIVGATLHRRRLINSASD